MPFGDGTKVHGRSRGDATRSCARQSLLGSTESCGAGEKRKARGWYQFIQFNSIQIKSCCVHSWMPHLLEFFPMKFREAILVHLSLSCFGLRAQG